MPDRPGRAAAALLVAAVLAAAGCGSPAEPAPASPASRTDPTSAVPHALPAAEPLTVAIPSIGVRTGRLIALGLQRSGEMEVPSDAGTTGWFKVGPTPGQVGPAIVAAHVNYRGVPGVFSRLHEVEPGDEITVERADGVPARFSAYDVERFPKSRFPTERIYGNTDMPELRLITCGGEFDPATRNYLDNVVVFARLVGA
jgi:hypothetical protein